MNSAESEQKAVRRDCIIDIIKIMEVSSPSEKREHVKKIKKELEIKSASTAPSVIVKQLTRMLKNLEREMSLANCFGKDLDQPSTNGTLILHQSCIHNINTKTVPLRINSS